MPAEAGRGWTPAMNILGMGTMEILVVLLLAFILLGPNRMVDAARLLGKATREIRRLSEELPRMTLDEIDGGAEEGSSPNTLTGAAENGRPESPGTTVPEEEGPVRFQPSDPGDKGKEAANDEPDEVRAP